MEPPACTGGFSVLFHKIIDVEALPLAKVYIEIIIDKYKDAQLVLHNILRRYLLL